MSFSVTVDLEACLIAVYMSLWSVWYMLVSRSASLCASDRPWIAAIEGYCMLYCSVSASKYLYERLNAGVNAPSHNVCRK